MKGAIEADHIAVNNYEMAIVGVIPLTFTKITGIDDQLQTVELPDHTVASGGNRGPIEFGVSLPAHHLTEQAAMEAWFKEGQYPVSPTYKKAVSLSIKSGTGAVVRSYAITGCFPYKRGLPELSMEAEGELAQTEWTFKADDIQPMS